MVCEKMYCICGSIGYIQPNGISKIESSQNTVLSKKGSTSFSFFWNKGPWKVLNGTKLMLNKSGALPN